MKYSQILKELRDKLFMTQTELAQMLGVSYTTVCRWETGVSKPRMKNRKQIVQLCKENNINDYAE